MIKRIANQTSFYYHSYLITQVRGGKFNVCSGNTPELAVNKIAAVCRPSETYVNSYIHLN